MIIPPLSAIPTPTFNPPTPSFTDLHGSTNVLINLLGREGPECADISRYRTTTNIVLSCLTTILACTWVALHLDLPRSSLSSWKYFSGRLCWMIIALIMPEHIAWNAFTERMVAKKYMDAWNKNFVPLCDPKIVNIRGKTSEQYARELKDKEYDSRWTLAHGFLASMGGIRYDVGDNGLQKFTPNDENSEDLKMRSIIQQIGLISCDDIQDKSKGDGLTKSLVVIQTTWFIVQCLARWTTHLPVTELEVVTLAYAVQNIFIYILWWNKPQSLSVPFRLYVEKDTEQLPGTLSAKSASEQEVPSLPHSLSENVIDEGPSSPLSGSEARHTVTRSRGRRESLLVNKVQGEDYGFFILLAGAMFHALHLIPIWLSTFPSDTERKMWQVSAFYVIATPLGLGVAVVFNMGTALCYCCLDTEDAATGLTVVFSFFVFSGYAVARVILLVLPFTTLRFLPKEAFRSVEWTRFIPHF